MAEPISITDAPTIPGISITTDQTPIDEGTAYVRAQRYNFAMGGDENSPGITELTQELLAGGEDGIRQRAAGLSDQEEYQARSDLLQDPAINADAGMAANIAMMKPHNPDSEMENRFANKMTNLGNYRSLHDVNIESGHLVMSLTQNVIAGNASAKRVYDDLHTKYGDYVDLAAMVPGYNYSRQVDMSKFDMNHPWSFALGTNLEAQKNEYYSLPQDQRYGWLKARTDEIAKTSPMDALRYAYVMSEDYGSTERNIDDLFAVMDFTSIGSLPTLGFALGRDSVKAFAAANAQFAKTVVNPNSSAVDILAASGDLAGAAKYEMLEQLVPSDRNVIPGVTKNEIAKLLPVLLDPASVTDKASGKLVTSQLNDLRTTLSVHGTNMVNAIADSGQINRIPEQRAAWSKAIELAQEDFKYAHPEVEDAILNMTPVHDSAINADFIQVSMGMKDKSFFKNVFQAGAYAKGHLGLRTGTYKINPNPGGHGFTVDFFQPVREDRAEVRDVVMDTLNQTPETLTNMVTGIGGKFQLRSPQYVLSEEARVDRLLVDYVPTKLAEAVKSTAKDIGRLGRWERGRLNKFEDVNRAFVNQATAAPGREFSTQGGFERAWKDVNGQLPNARESKAYWSMLQLKQAHYLASTYHIYKNKIRAGFQSFSVGYTGKNPAGKFTKLQTQAFEGRMLRSVPWESRTPFTVLYHDAATGQFELIGKKEFEKGGRDFINELTTDGKYRTIQVSEIDEPELRKLVGVTGKINFVVTKNYDVGPIKFAQLPYVDGLPQMYHEGSFVKQAKIVRYQGGHYYDGDTTVRMISKGREAFGKAYVKSMNVARKLLQAEKQSFIEDEAGKAIPGPNTNPAVLDDYLKKNLQDFTPDEFRKLFQTHLDVDEDLHLIPAGSNVKQHTKLNDKYVPFYDNFSSEHNMLPPTLRRYIAERDQLIKQVGNSGTEGNPIYNTVPARLISPVKVVNRLGKDIVNSRIMDDYKIKSSEQFIAQFGKHLNTSTQELRENPIYHLYNPVFLPGTDRKVKSAAMNFRRATIELMGVKSEDQIDYQYIKEKLLPFAYNMAGEKGVDIVDDKVIPLITSPDKFLRTMMVHAKLGLFNFVQVPVQAQQFANIFAISPIHASNAMAVSTMQRWLALNGNRAIVKDMAKKATKWGMSEKDFMQSFEAMKKYGLWHVGGEHTFMDSLEPKMLTTKFGRFMDHGLVFFRETERMIRLAAWNTAYLEWKHAPESALQKLVKNAAGEYVPVKPTKRSMVPTMASHTQDKVFDENAERWVLERMNLLNNDMTRSSLAAWQKGVFSPITQFFTYQTRLTEQMWSKRLTWAERGRLALVHGALYGLPVGAGIALPFNPLSLLPGGSPAFSPVVESWKEYANSKKWDIQSDAILNYLTHGVVAPTMATITGERQLNVGERYGAQGLTFFKEMLQAARGEGDKNFLEALAPSSSMLYHFAQNYEPFVAKIGDLMGGADYDLMPEHWVDATKDISSVNNFLKGFYGLSLGLWYGKNAGVKDTVTPWEAVNGAINGLEPQDFGDAYKMFNSVESMKATKEAIEPMVITNITRGLRAYADGNMADGDAFFRNARIHMKVGQFNPDEQQKMINQALNGNAPITEKANQAYLKAFPDRLDQVMEIQQRRQQWLKDHPQ